MAHVYNTAVAILYSASRLLFSDCQNKVQKHNITNRKRLSWCELINP